MTMARLALVVLCILCLSGVAGCGTPCGNLWKKLERCAKTDADRKLYRSKDIKRAFLARCRKSDKSRIKECIKVRDCEKLRRCADRIRN
jgi:hypothetical protein